MLPHALDAPDVAVSRDDLVVETAAEQAPARSGQAGEPVEERVGDLAVVHRPAEPPQPAERAGLTERELAVLDLERRRYRHQGAKEQAVRDELDLSATRYYQVLNALLDDPAALAHDPVLVGRLRRLRDARTADAPQ